MKWLWRLLLVLGLLAVGVSVYPWRGSDAGRPESDKEPESPTQRQIADQAKAAMERKDYAAAVRHFTAGLEGMPDGPEKALILATRGKTQFLAGSPKAALEDYDAALRMVPELPFFVFRGRGEVNIALGDFDKAVADLTESIRQWPRGPESYDLRARAFRGLSRDVEANADEREAEAERVRLQRQRVGEKPAKQQTSPSPKDFQAMKAAEPALKSMLKANTDGVLSVAFGPDGETLASAGGEVIELWNLGTGKVSRSLNGPIGIFSSVSISQDGKLLAAIHSNNTIQLWDMATGKEHVTLQLNAQFVWCVAFSPVGKTLASGSDDNRFKLWNVADGKERSELKGHESPVNTVAFSPDGKTLASGDWDKTIKLWDVLTEKERLSLNGHKERINSVAFSPDGRTLASGSFDKTIKFWDVATGEVQATLKGHERGVQSVAFSPDGKTLASASPDKTIKLWDTKTTKELATLKGHTGWVNTVAFSPDGRTLASGGQDGTILLWDMVAVGQPGE